MDLPPQLAATGLTFQVGCGLQRAWSPPLHPDLQPHWTPPASSRKSNPRCYSPPTLNFPLPNSKLLVRVERHDQKCAPTLNWTTALPNWTAMCFGCNKSYQFLDWKWKWSHFVYVGESENYLVCLVRCRACEAYFLSLINMRLACEFSCQFNLIALENSLWTSR
jgi:hypothetical protein